MALGFLLGLFLVWRLCRAWDLNEEKILDLTILTFIGGLIGARIYFAVSNWQIFAPNPFNLILFNKVPGFSFWGGILGGWLTLFYLARRYRMNFWQLADIAVVGLLGGLILSDIGCFLGGCSSGSPSQSFFAVTQVGLIGKRWPVQIVEAFLLLISLKKVWSKALHFHQTGKIAAIGFLYIGVIRLILEPFRQNHSSVFFSVVLTLLGLTIYFKVTKQDPVVFIKSLIKTGAGIFTDAAVRKRVVQNVRQSWYNQKTSFSWKLRNLKKFLRRFNVKFS